MFQKKFQGKNRRVRKITIPNLKSKSEIPTTVLSLGSLEKFIGKQYGISEQIKSKRKNKAEYQNGISAWDDTNTVKHEK